MATHSNILAWRIPWTGEPGGLQSIGSHRVRHNWSHTGTHIIHLCNRANELYSTLATSCKELIHWKGLWCWEGLGAGGRRGRQRMRWLDGITDSMAISWSKLPGVGDEQGGLACCDSWGHKESDMTEQLNWTELNMKIWKGAVLEIQNNGK